jgi:hypothetical protein
MGQETELALTTGEPDKSSVRAICSPGLWTLLTGEGDWRPKVRVIATTPGLRGQIDAMIPELEAALAPGDPVELAQILAMAAPGFNLQPRSPGQWGATWDSYLAVLADTPAFAVREAFVRWGRAELYPDTPGRCGFYPSTADLYTLAKRSMADLNNALFRARAAVRHVEPRGPATPEERAKVKAMMEEDRAKGRGVFTPSKTMVGDMPVRPRESRSQMADRIRRLASEGPEEVV